MSDARDDLSPEGFVWHLLRRVRFLSDDDGPAGQVNSKRA